jgi:hypothetical protein
MYGNDPIFQTLKAEREREVAELRREREYRKACETEPSGASESIASVAPVPLWRRVAYALHLPLPKTSPRSA